MMSLARCVCNLQFPIFFNIICISVKDLYLPFLVALSTRSSTRIPYTIWLFYIWHFEWFAPSYYWLYDDVSLWYFTFPVYLVFSFFLFTFLFILFTSFNTHVDHLVHWIRLAVEYTLRTVCTLLFQNKHSRYTVQSLWKSRQSVSFWGIPSFQANFLEMLYDSLFLLYVDIK